MLLAELIKEKDYIEKSIYNLRKRIVSLSSGDNEGLVEKCFEELENLYNKHQKFSISIERTKSKAFIKVNNTKLSLADAIAIKESMEHKLKVYEFILGSHTNVKSRAIDLEGLYTTIDNICLDIKTMEGEISFGLWNVEVS